MRLKESYLLICLLAFLLFCKSAFAQGVDVTINLKAIAGLQFDKARFVVRPGDRVKIVLENTDDMSHNMLITQPGSRLEIVNAALKLGQAGPAQNYIPKSPKVLWAIPVLSPGESKSIQFTAPKDQGVYPYVCTYPGHGFVMFGAMYVTTDALPAIQNDPNVPENRKNDGTHDDDLHAKHSPGPPKALHPYAPVAPYLYRIFMPDASPAAIAINLPGEISYCWDAGTCHLRYAWQGGFLNNAAHWKGNGNALAELQGPVFFRDKTTYPLHINKPENIPAVDFKGYQLKNRFPEFHYTINNTDVYELIHPKASGVGLIRTFRIPNAKKTIWFVVDAADGVSYEASAGKWVNGKLKLSRRQARNFTITMTKKGGAAL